MSCCSSAFPDLAQHGDKHGVGGRWSLLTAWTLGWGFSTLRHLKSNFSSSICKDSAAPDVLRGLSARTQTPIPTPPRVGILTRPVVRGSDPFTEGRN